MREIYCLFKVLSNTIATCQSFFALLNHCSHGQITKKNTVGST